MKTKRNNMNIFLKYIYNKPSNIIKLFFYKFKMKKFRRDILRSSPSFIILWQMADFIKYAERIFFYSNNLSDSLYSSDDYEHNRNGFKVNNKEYDVTITIKLYKETSKVALEISRGKNKKTTTMYFIHEQWDKEPTVYDEMLLEQSIKIINCEIIKLFDECYNLR